MNYWYSILVTKSKHLLLLFEVFLIHRVGSNFLLPGLIMLVKVDLSLLIRKTLLQHR